MNRTIIISYILITIVSFCSNRNNSHAHDKTLIPNDSLAIFGVWKITRFTSGSISEITDEDARKYVGQKVSLKPSIAIINGDTCNRPIFKMSTQNSDKYFFENNRIDKASLKIKQDNIQVVEMGCKGNAKYSNENSPNFLYDFIVIEHNLVIVNFKGFYFYMERELRAF